MKRVTAFLIGVLAQGAAWAAAPLEVIVFPGGFNWPLWVGQEKGFFAGNGLEVKITPTPNSVFQMQNLAAGKFDIAFSAIDNVVAYDEGQGEAPLAEPVYWSVSPSVPAAGPEIVTFCGLVEVRVQVSEASAARGLPASRASVRLKVCQCWRSQVLTTPACLA